MLRMLQELIAKRDVIRLRPFFISSHVSAIHAILCFMKKSTLFIFLTPIVLFLSIPFSHAIAQGPIELKSLTIKLWPEYDDPRLLVIIDGELTNPGSEIRLPIPEGATLNAVASANSSGRLLKNDWHEEKAEDGGRLLVMIPENPLFRVEYYTNFPSDGAKRTIKFELPAGYFNTEFASIEILLPPSSSDITLSPPADESGADGEEAHLFQRTLGEIKDAPIVQEITYVNPENALTAPRPEPSAPTEQEPPAAPQPQASSPISKSSLNPWILILGVAALLLIAGGVVGLWLTREKEPEETYAAPTSPKSKRKKSHIVSASTSKNLDRFCRQCGREFGPDDRFCRYCGAPRQSL